MTLKVRRLLLNTMLLPAIAAIVGIVWSWVAWSRGVFPGDVPVPSLRYQWWGITSSGSSADILLTMIGLSFLAVLVLISELLFRHRFGRSPSSELFFLRLFMLTLSLQAVRLLVPLAETGVINSIWASSATRMVWFGRLLGLTVLINVGLYSGEIPFRRSGAILGTGALAAMAIAVSIPLDSTQITGNLLLRSGAHSSLALLCVIVSALSVLTLIGTAYTQKKNRYYVLAAMLLFVAAGADLIFFFSMPLIIPGAALLVTGIIGFSVEIRKIYLWV